VATVQEFSNQGKYITNNVTITIATNQEGIALVSFGKK